MKKFLTFVEGVGVTLLMLGICAIESESVIPYIATFGGLLLVLAGYLGECKYGYYR